MSPALYWRLSVQCTTSTPNGPPGVSIVTEAPLRAPSFWSMRACANLVSLSQSATVTGARVRTV